MPFAAALSTATPTARALDDVCTQALKHLDAKPDLALVFFSPHHAGEAAAIAAVLGQRLTPRCLLGCLGESIVGNEAEVEQSPALSLWLAAWQKPVGLEPCHITLEQTAEGPSLLGWPDSMCHGSDSSDSRGTRALLLLGDPFTFPVNEFLQQVNDDHRGLRVMGGMASGVRGPGQCRLVLGDQVHRAGAVGVLLTGDGILRSIVSQGCRPIGRHMVITRGHDNIIDELGGRPPMQHLQELWPQLSPADQKLLEEGLHVGVVINEYQGQFQRGDFLVRNVIGMERESGAMAITDHIRVGQTVQFHVRDAATADEDLRALLKHDQSTHAPRPGAALLFTCNGRGTRLFAEPHHDTGLVRSEAGNIPVAGFFAQGELGPIGGQNFIHGFTASVVLFEE
jgi:small ligand-binding sensory domain FIST